MTNIIQPSRRSFITGLTSLIVAPAIVRVESLMPVKAVKSNELWKNYWFDEETYKILKLKLYKHSQVWSRFDNGEIKIIPLTEIYENKI